MIQKITQNNWNFWTVNLIMRAKKTVNQSSDFPVRRTGSYRHKKALDILFSEINSRTNLADRQRNRETDTLVTILRFVVGSRVINHVDLIVAALSWSTSLDIGVSNGKAGGQMPRVQQYRGRKTASPKIFDDQRTQKCIRRLMIKFADEPKLSDRNKLLLFWLLTCLDCTMGWHSCPERDATSRSVKYSD